MELKGNKAVVFTPDGEFKKTRLPGGEYELGQEVEFSESGMGYMYKWGAIAAVLVLALVIPYVFSITALDTKAYAYVDLDVNPSVEFTINRQSRVIEAKGLNIEGEEVLKDADLIGKKIDYGIEYFALRSFQLGYANAEKNYILATTVFEEGENIKLEERIKESLEKTVEKSKIPVEIGVLTATKEIKEEADKAGISSGKYLILLQASDEKIQVDINDMRGKSAVKAIKEAGGDIDEIIKEAQKDKKELNELLKRNREKIMDKGKEKGNDSPKILPINEWKKDSKDGIIDLPANDNAKDKPSDYNEIIKDGATKRGKDKSPSGDKGKKEEKGNKNENKEDKGSPGKGNNAGPGEKNDKPSSEHPPEDVNAPGIDREIKTDRDRDNISSPGKKLDINIRIPQKGKKPGLAEDIIMELLD
jgi:hypothetical protein